MELPLLIILVILIIYLFFKRINDKNINKLNISFVTKKKLGNAVMRNKIKRRLRNIMNEAYKKIDINLNYSYLLVAKKMIFDVWNLVSQSYIESQNWIYQNI